MVVPDLSRPTARQHEGFPDMPRDLLAAILQRHLDHGAPEDGDRVRVHDGITRLPLAKGRWTGTADDEAHLGSVATDGGGTFLVPDGSLVDVLVPQPRPRPAVLTRDELFVAGELAAELAAVYAGEPVAAVADELARRILAALDDDAPAEG